MSLFFPLLNDTKIYNCSTTVYNFPPNDYEQIKNKSRFLSLIWLGERGWETYLIDELEAFESREIYYDSFNSIIPPNVIVILSLTTLPLEKNLKSLPVNTVPESTPIWRSTISVHINNNSASYQGEIQAFPEKASLLSFSTFLQKRKYHKNFLIFINLEDSCYQRKSYIKLAKANRPKNIIGEFIVKTNCCNIVELDKFNLEKNDIAIFYSSEISGIPIFLSYSEKDNSISLEHTHPPSNLIIHGERKKAQKQIKKNWFSLLKK